MFEWSEELMMVRDAVRTFVDTEIRPHREELEHGDMPPYDLLRKLYKTFGMDQMAADSFDKRIAAEESARRRPSAPSGERASGGGGGGGFTMLPIIELCKCSPGMVTAMGVSVGLTVGRDHVEGHDRAEEALGPRRAHDGQDRRVGDHRAELRFRRVRVDGVDRAPRRRRVRAQRLEDLHHQRSRTPTRSCSSASSTRATSPPSARSCSSCSTAACPASSSRSRCARWDCTRRPPACCSSTTCAPAATACSARAKRRSAAARAARRRRRRS